MTPDFFDLNYLSNGSSTQRKGFQAIRDLGIMDSMKEYTPVVVGTLPLDLFTDKSDIDILCCYRSAEDYAEKVFFDLYAASHHFYINRKDLGGVESTTTSFEYEGFQFEIVGQKVPVKQQAGFRHMVAEWRILSEKDLTFKNEILELKRSGLKTEPAFAKALGLTGDPYEALLQ